MTDRVAKLLAKVTAGTTLKPKGSGGGTVSNVNLVMGALGMGRAGRPATLVLFAHHCDDDRARAMLTAWLQRWAWITWHSAGDPRAMVSVDQVNSLAAMAVDLHTIPGTRKNLKEMAAILGVNHQTFTRKYRRHLDRCLAELQYLEEQGTRALLKHL